MRRITAVSVMLWCICYSAPLFAQAEPAQPPPANRAQADPTAGVFYKALQPYGEWVGTDICGWAWTPYNMPFGWRPYAEGRWAFTGQGWLWVSDWPWGWACFHYGRWFDDPTYGWCWCPATVWAPAWVLWRTNADYIGWAPCPPGILLRPGGEITINSDYRQIPAQNYCFVPVHRFTSAELAPFILPAERNVVPYGATTPVITLTSRNDEITNPLPNQNYLEQVLRRPVQQYQIVETPSLVDVITNPINQGQVLVFRPDRNWELAANIPTLPPINVPGTPPILAPPSLLDRQERERREARDKQATERRLLEEKFELERGNPPPDVAPEPLRQRQADERRLLLDWQAEELRQLEARLREERHEAERAALKARQLKQQQAGQGQNPAPGVDAQQEERRISQYRRNVAVQQQREREILANQQRLEAELQQRQAAELQLFDQQSVERMQELQRRQGLEFLDVTTTGTPVDIMRQNHRAEQQAFAQQIARERQLLLNRQARELQRLRSVVPPPAGQLPMP